MSKQFEKYLKYKIKQITPDVYELKDYHINIILNKLKKKYIRYFIILLNEYESNTINKREKYIEFEKKLISSEEHFLTNDIINNISSDITKILKYIDSINNNLINNKDDIEEKFNIKLNDYVLEFGQGDTHNNGKEVVIIKTKKTKIVYKPSNYDSTTYYNVLLEEIACNTNFSYYKINIKNYKDFSIHEYISTKSLTTVEEVKSYYYNFGALIAVSHILGSIDLHNENIIAHGKYPTIIDYETIFSGNRKLKKTLHQKLVDQVNDSIFESLLVHSNIVGFSITDINFSPLNVKANNVDANIKIPYVEKEGKSDMCIKEGEAGLVQNNKCVPMLKNSSMYYEKFIYDIIQGFDEIINFINENKEKLKKIIDLMPNIELRTIHRPTFLYEKYLTALRHPDYITNEKKDKLYKILKNSTIKFDEKIFEEEKKQLQNNDVPYFITYFKSRGIFNKNGILLRNDYFSQSAYEKILSRLNNLNTEWIKKNNEYLILSLEMNKKKLFGISKPIQIKANTTENLKDTILSEIKNKIQDTYYLYPTHLMNDKYGFTFYYNGVYEVGGIALILIQEYKKTKDAEVLEMIKTIQKTFKSSKNNVSSFHGMGSELYIQYQILKNVSSMDNIIINIENLLDDIFNQLNRTNEMDFISGISGLLAMLSNIYLEDILSIKAKQKIYSILTTSIKIIQEKLDTNKITIGLGHGFSGIAYGIYKANIIINNSRNNEYIQYLINCEDKYMKKSKKGWNDIRVGEFIGSKMNYWCYGDIGCIVVRHKLKNILSENYQIPELIQNKKNESHCLCHGKMGNAVLKYEITKNVKEYTSEKDEIYNEILEYGYLNGININHLFDNLMTSILGTIYYSYENPPNILLMDV